MHYDPYSNEQLRALRRDPTGRYISLEERMREPWWYSFGGGAIFGCVLAVLFWVAL